MYFFFSFVLVVDISFWIPIPMLNLFSLIIDYFFLLKCLSVHKRRALLWGYTRPHRDTNSSQGGVPLERVLGRLSTRSELNLRTQCHFSMFLMLVSSMSQFLCWSLSRFSFNHGKLTEEPLFSLLKALKICQRKRVNFHFISHFKASHNEEQVPLFCVFLKDIPKLHTCFDLLNIVKTQLLTSPTAPHF